MVGRRAHRPVEGFVRHEAHRLCQACCKRAKNCGSYPDPAPAVTARRLTRKRVDWLEDWKILDARGLTKRECAVKLDMSMSGLDQALYRARKAGVL
jgi:predicted DNA-binding protein (UPF0251 family)